MILIDNRAATDPDVNLAIEEYLVRHADCRGKDYLLLYVNEPCIALGKNQSIWKEVNFEYLRNGKLKICRRISGGGTVYHDAGNLNFAFVSEFADSKINNYRWFNEPVVKVLRKAGIEAEMDERNNILYKGKKISGSAQFTNRKNIISHGTLLLHADLKTLSACLKKNDFEIETKAVDSVRSEVLNIQLDAEELKQKLISELDIKEVHPFKDDEWETILRLAEEKFKTLEWIYGRSPHTRIVRQETEIEIEQGRVVSVKGKEIDANSLQGVYYQYDEIKKALSVLPNASSVIEKVF